MEFGEGKMVSVESLLASLNSPTEEFRGCCGMKPACQQCPFYPRGKQGVTRVNQDLVDFFRANPEATIYDYGRYVKDSRGDSA